MTLSCMGINANAVGLMLQINVSKATCSDEDVHLVPAAPWPAAPSKKRRTNETVHRHECECAVKCLIIHLGTMSISSSFCGREARGVVESTGDVT